MAKKQPQPKDNMRVTIRFRDEIVAEEFHRQAAEANKRPSPFAAELIERALTDSDAKEFENATLHRELEELRGSLDALRELPRKLSDNDEDNDEVLAGLAALRREVSDLKESRTDSIEPSSESREALKLLRKLQADVAELAALPRVFVKLREDVATGIRPLLVRACKLTHQEAEDWIRRNLLEE